MAALLFLMILLGIIKWVLIGTVSVFSGIFAVILILAGFATLGFIPTMIVVLIMAYFTGGF